jgi:glycerate kinase
MQIVLAPNALKGSLSATAAARAMASGVRKVLPQAKVVCIPVADGGDGAAEVLRDHLQARPVRVTASGPLGTPLQAAFYYNPERRLALMEMASVAGLALLTPEQYDPLHATTRGVGELLLAAQDQGAREVILGIGGSATCDGGVGMAHALGVRFFDAQGQALAPLAVNLAAIHRIEMSGLDPRLQDLQLEVMCDVDNPLLGEHGASQVYAPQKGATGQQMAQLEHGLQNLAAVIQQQLGLAVADLPGAGAAGGLGAGLLAFLGARLSRGIDVVLDHVGLDAALEGADLVLTAEGQVDAQTAHGKAPAGVALRARRQGVPCVILAGSVAGDGRELMQQGASAMLSICPGPQSLAQAMSQAAAQLEFTAEQVLRIFCAAGKTGVTISE